MRRDVILKYFEFFLLEWAILQKTEVVYASYTEANLQLRKHEQKSDKQWDA